MSDTTTDKKPASILAAEALEHAYSIGTSSPGFCDEPGDWDAAETADIAGIIREAYAPTLAALRELAKLRVGPRPANRGAWVDKVLSLAARAREVLGENA